MTPDEGPRIAAITRGMKHSGQMEDGFLSFEGGVPWLIRAQPRWGVGKVPDDLGSTAHPAPVQQHQIVVFLELLGREPTDISGGAGDHDAHRGSSSPGPS